MVALIAAPVERIGRARGGTPGLHIVDMRDGSWRHRVMDLTDGHGDGPEKVAYLTSDEDRLNTVLELMCVSGVLYIQENLYTRERRLSIDPYAQPTSSRWIRQTKPWRSPPASSAGRSSSTRSAEPKLAPSSAPGTAQSTHQRAHPAGAPDAGAR